MKRRLLLIQAHPDAGGNHFGEALLSTYAGGADAAGRELRRVVLNQLDFGLIDSAGAWHDAKVPADIVRVQRDVVWAEHLVLFYPLWLGDMPALLKGFLEQLLRPGFAFSEPQGRPAEKLLAGRSARIVVTMGMPALAYRGYYAAHSVRSLKRNILHFCGIRPVRTSCVGAVEGSEANRRRWLERMRKLGYQAR